jgi:lipopolysaccharide/colanic/teichoic acid biosynthesis glycosyltransferase
VGPRPHPLDDYAQYSLEQLRRLEVRPGITGLWQVTARRDPGFETTMLLDLKYIDDWNLLLDFKLLLKTIPAVCKGLGQ